MSKKDGGCVVKGCKEEMWSRILEGQDDDITNAGAMFLKRGAYCFEHFRLIVAKVRQIQKVFNSTGI